MSMLIFLLTFNTMHILIYFFFYFQITMMYNGPPRFYELYPSHGAAVAAAAAAAGTAPAVSSATDAVAAVLAKVTAAGNTVSSSGGLVIPTDRSSPHVFPTPVDARLHQPPTAYASQQPTPPVTGPPPMHHDSGVGPLQPYGHHPLEVLLRAY